MTNTSQHDIRLTELQDLCTKSRMIVTFLSKEDGFTIHDMDMDHETNVSSISDVVSILKAKNRYLKTVDQYNWL